MTTNETLKKKLKDARDLATPSRELESLCAAALTRIDHLEWLVEDCGGDPDPERWKADELAAQRVREGRIQPE